MLSGEWFFLGTDVSITFITICNQHHTVDEILDIFEINSSQIKQILESQGHVLYETKHSFLYLFPASRILYHGHAEVCQISYEVRCENIYQVSLHVIIN